MSSIPGPGSASIALIYQLLLDTEEEKVPQSILDESQQEADEYFAGSGSVGVAPSYVYEKMSWYIEQVSKMGQKACEQLETDEKFQIRSGVMSLNFVCNTYKEANGDPECIKLLDEGFKPYFDRLVSFAQSQAGNVALNESDAIDTLGLLFQKAAPGQSENVISFLKEVCVRIHSS